MGRPFERPSLAHHARLRRHVPPLLIHACRVAVIRSAEKHPSGVDNRRADAVRADGEADRALRTQRAAAVRLATVAARRCDRFAELQPRALFAAALTAACRRRHRSRHSGSHGIGHARWACTSLRMSARRACAQCCLRRPASTMSSASAPARSRGRTRERAAAASKVRDRATGFGCSAARPARGWRCSKVRGKRCSKLARERECCIMRVHEGLTAERTSPGRAQPSPDLAYASRPCGGPK